MDRKVVPIDLNHRAICGGCFEFFTGKGCVIQKDDKKLRTLCLECIKLIQGLKWPIEPKLSGSQLNYGELAKRFGESRVIRWIDESEGKDDPGAFIMERVKEAEAKSL